jgi:hypothetical protein
MLPSVRFAAVSRPLLAPLAQACFMSSTALLFERNGEPSDVLQLHSQLQLPSLQDTDISVEILSVSCARLKCSEYMLMYNVF